MKTNELLESAAVRRVALFAPCCECRCEGFRPWIEGTPANYEKHHGLFYFDLKVYDEYDLLERCMTCDHDLREHTNAVVGMKRDDRNYYSQMVEDASRLHGMLTGEQDRDKLKIMLQVYEAMILALRKAISTPERILLYCEKDTLPFTRPNAVQVLATFITNLTDKKQERHQLFRMATELLTRMNKWEPPTPEKFEYKGAGVTVPTYKLFFSQWYIRVAMPQKFKTLVQYEFPEIFGAKTLTLFVRHYVSQRLDEKKKDPIYLFAKELLKQHELLRTIANEGEIAKPEVTKYLKYRKHVRKREGNGMEIELLYGKKRQYTAYERNLNFFDHKTMLEVLATMVEIERCDMFVDETTGEDKMSADVAKAEIVKQEVEAGLVRFAFMKNNIDAGQSHADLAWLVQLKTLFNAQLPKMGAEYITRLVFDPYHHNLALIRNCRVIGGCCFRPFPERKFIEIVFLAVSSHDQIKGYGTILMNYMKDYAVRKGMLVLLTYADSFATGYFKKQGFTSKIDVSKKIYQGHIKEYEGATLMACQLHPMIRYVTFAPYIKGVRDMQAAINVCLNPLRSQVFDSLEENFQENNNPAIEANRLPVPLPWESIPGVDPPKFEDYPPDNLDDILKEITLLLKEHPCSWPFMEPVPDKDVPEYKEYVKYPVDFEMISQRIANNYYTHQRLFIADLCRLFSNCYSFNSSDTEYYRCGIELNIFCNAILEEKFPCSDVYPILPDPLYPPVHRDFDPTQGIPC